jgi:transporter associated domain-containing protein
VEEESHEGVETLGGLITSTLGRIPEVGEQIGIGGRAVRVEARSVRKRAQSSVSAARKFAGTGHDEGELRTGADSVNAPGQRLHCLRRRVVISSLAGDRLATLRPLRRARPVCSLLDPPPVRLIVARRGEGWRFVRKQTRKTFLARHPNVACNTHGMNDAILTRRICSRATPLLSPWALRSVSPTAHSFRSAAAS